MVTHGVQNKALLDTLCHQKFNNKSNTTQGHIYLFSTLLIGHKEHWGKMLISSLPCVPKKWQQSQDWVFILLPGISNCAFQLRVQNVWFCKVLLLITINTKTDAGMKTHKCACFYARGVQRSQKTKSYFTYSAYFVYLPYCTYSAYSAFNSVLLLHRLVTVGWLCASMVTSLSKPYLDLAGKLPAIQHNRVLTISTLKLYNIYNVYNVL